MASNYHYSPRGRRNKEEILQKIFAGAVKTLEFLAYGLVWLVKILGTIIAGIFYGLAVGLVFVSKELWRFAKWARPYVKTFLVRYFLPTVGKLLVFLALGIKYAFIYLAVGIKYFFIYSGKGLAFLFSRFWHWIEYDFAPWADNVFIPWVQNKFAPFVKAKAPVVARGAAIFAKYFALAVFYLIKGFYLASEFILKTLWQAASILTNQLQGFFGPKVQYAYDHREEIKATTRTTLQEFKLFAFWLLRPVTRLIPDKFERGFLPPQNELALALQPAIGYSDFRQLIRDPRQTLLRKTLASWMVFFIIVTTVGIGSFTPVFDWLFGSPEYTYAAPFTGAIKVSKQSTTLSTAGDWYKSMAFSGDGVNGDGDYFQPAHPGATSEGAAGTLAIGYVTFPTVTANAYDSAGAQFIPWKPNANGNFYGVTLAVQNVNTVANNTNVVVEVLRFPTASYTGTPPTVVWSNYVACSALNTCVYAADTVIERQAVMRFDQSISGETAYPGQYGIHYMDFRFDPLAVTTGVNYGFRVYYNNLTTTAGWPRNGATKPLINATNFGLGVTDVDTTNASTVTIPLAQTTAASFMVAINSAPAVGQAAVARTQNEHWTGTYSTANTNWTIAGSVSGAQTAKLTTATTGGTGASYVNDGATMTTLTANATAATRLCVNSISGFAADQYIDIWDSQTTSIVRTIGSVNASDGACPSSGPSIITTVTLAATDAFTTAKNATVARATWKLRLIQGAEEAMTQYISTTKFCVANASAFSVPPATYNNINLWDNDSAVGANRITAITVDDAACTTTPGDDSVTVATTIAAFTTAQNAHVAEISSNISNFGTPSDGAIFRFTSLNMGQNPTKTGPAATFRLLYGKTAAPATSQNNYPWITFLRHPFYTAYGDADTSAPVDGDMVLVGGGAADPDTGDSTNLSNDLLLTDISPHTVTVDKNFDMPLAYSGATGGGVGNGTVTAATASYGGTGFNSMLLTTRAKLAVSNSANKRYRLVAPGRILLSSGATLELGSSSAVLPQTATVDLYEDSSGPTVSTALTVDSGVVTYVDVASTAGFYIGDVVMIKDNNSVPLTRIITAVTSGTRLTFTVAMVAGYTTAQTATVSRGQTTDIPTGADRRSFIWGGATSVGGRVGMTSYGVDTYRTAQANLAVDVDGDIDTGYLGAQQTNAGNTYMDVAGTLAGNWTALDPVSVAQGTNYAVNNWDSSIRMGANDDANAFPTWTGGAGLSGNADPVYNTEITEIGTIPLTNIYNSDYNTGSPLYSSNYATSSPWTIFNDNANTETNDAVYFGDQGTTPVYALEFNIGAAINANATRVWEYYNGATWTEFTPSQAWKYVTRGTNNYGAGEYCMPFNADPAVTTATVQLTDTNTYVNAGQWVKIKDDDSPTIIRRISSVTAGAPANVVFAEVIPSGYTTAQNAKVCIPNGGQWMPMTTTDLFTQTGRTLISWNSWDTASPAKTTINGVNAYWVRNRISAFTSWTTSPTNQTTPVSMQGVETVNSTPLTVFNGANEALFNNLSKGASFDPNETWVLRYNDNSTATSTLKTTRWYESQTASWGTAHRWQSPNPDGETSAYYEKNVAEAAGTNWRSENGDFSWTDYNVTAKVYMNQIADTTTRRLGVFMRQDAENYGLAAYITKTTSAQTLGWYSTAFGTESTIGSATTITFAANTWYCLKAEVNGVTLQAKFWAPVTEDADCNGDANEPVGWTESESNIAFTAGRFGLAADTIVGRFDDVTVKNTAGTETWFNDNFNDTGCWNVIGSIHGSQGCAYASTPFTSSYINFTIKHKGGVQSGETGTNAVIGPLNAPEQGDEIYISPLARESNIGLDETAGITTSNANTKYENWDFVYNPTASNYTVTGSQYGSAGTATPGSTYTSPGGEIALKVKTGAPTGPKFGSRAAYLQNSIQRATGNFTGLNNQSSAILIQPYWTVSGSATQYNIEGSSGVAAQKGTIDFWFKPNFTGSPDYIQYLFDYAANSNTDRILVRIMPNGVMEAVVGPAFGVGANTKLSKAFSAVAGQWYHFRLAWEDSDSGQLNMKRAWVDGAAFTTNQGSTLGARAASAGLIRLGNSWQYNAGFDGAIDEFAIFNDAVDTSVGDNWGDFTPPTSAYTAGQSLGTSTNIGANIFLTHFDTAVDLQKGFQNADYFVGHPVIVFTNGADTITNDRIRVVTYPYRTRIWTDNTGSPYTPSARVKQAEGYVTTGDSQGWMTGFQYHHRAASTNAATPITSPVLNLRKQIRIWSDEDVIPANNTAPINQGYGALIYYPKNIDINHLEMQNLYYGLYFAYNPLSLTSPTQYIRKSAFNMVRQYPYYVTTKTLGSVVIDNNNFANNDQNYYAITEVSSANMTISNNYFMGYSSQTVYMSGGRVFTLSGNKFINASYFPVSLGAGTAKVTLSNNEFWRFRRGLALNGNAFITMSGNTYDGGVSYETQAYYGTGIYVAPGTTNVEISDNGSIFGRSIWNEVDVNMPEDTSSYLAGSLLRYTGENLTLNSPFHYLAPASFDKFGNEYIQTAIPGVDVRFVSGAGGKDITNYSNFGNMRTTGSGLADTMVRTSGGYGWRLESTSKTDALEYTAKVVGVSSKPLAITGYIRLNANYGTSNLPTVTLSGLGMTGPNLTWTAAVTADTWQQFVVSGTPTESALATLVISVKSTPTLADSGAAENVDDAQGINLPTIIEDTDKSWTIDQWAGYKMRDDKGFVFDIIGNTPNRLFLKGTRIPFADTLPTQPYGGTYEVFSTPYVYLDDVSVLSGTVDTGTLDFHSSGQPVSPFLNTGLTAEAVWSAQYGVFSDIAGSFGQLLNDRLAIKRGLVSDASASTTAFITNFTETTSNFYQNQVVVMMSGQNDGISRRIASYDGATKTITVDAALPFAPAFNDEFIILSQYVSSNLTASDIWNYTTRRLSDATLTGGGSIATQADITALNNLSAAQVWSYGARTLTGGVTLSNPEQVWNVATSLLTTLGSIGKLIVDNLDASVSTRSTLTAADVWAAATRTITGITDPGLAALATAVWTNATRTLTADDVTAQRVWDTLLSAITTTNSIGLLLKTNVDSQLSVMKTDLTAEINANEVKIDTLIANLIVAQKAVDDLTPSATQFKTTLTNANDDFYNGGVLVFTSGLNSGQVRQISDYVGADKKITVNPALTIAPSNSDAFTILAQTANTSLDAGSIWSYATRRLTDAQLDSGSLATLANLSSQITQTQKITVGEIINQDTSIKSGNSLTILFRADSGLTGNNRPKVNVWNPAGTQVVTDQYMTELGSTGVYKYALTFESAWSTGQFTVQSSEDTNNTKDSINISVNSTDLATVANTIDLLANDLISIRSSVSTASASSTVSLFGTNLTSAVNDLYNNALITFISGDNAGVARRIEDYNSTTKVLTIEPDLPSAPANGDSFTILKQIAVPTTKIATIQSDVSTIKTDVALIKSRLDNVDSSISALTSKVTGVSSVTQVYQVRPEDMFSSMSTISTAIQSINTTLGKLDNTLLASLLSISQESLADVKYIRNKLADFKAITTVQRQILESPEASIIRTWFTSGSVDLNVMISNPSDRSQKIPIRVYLPKETKMEHIMENGGLDIQYDVQLDTLYAIGEFQLGPKESLKKTIKMRDIWQITEEDLNLMKTQAENLLKQLEKTQFSAQAVLLKNDLDTRTDKIIRTQAENIASPQDKIMTYRENKESLSAVQKDLDELKSLVTQSAAARGFLGAFGGVQTIAVWGIIIAFVTGFGLMIMVLFMMWRHQMRLAGGQLALQSHIISGGKVDTQTLAKIFADGVVTEKEEDTLSKYLTAAEIERVKKRLSKGKIQEISKKFSVSFFAYLKKLLTKFGLKIFVALIAIAFIAGLIFVSPKLIKNVSSIFSGTKIPAPQANVQPPIETVPAVIPLESPDSPVATTSELLTSDSEQKSATGLEKPIFIQIKQTPTGWLNVRKEPSKTAEIISKVNVGEKIEAIGLEETKKGEKFDWYRIVLPDGQEGWVYGEYVKIVVGE